MRRINTLYLKLEVAAMVMVAASTAYAACNIKGTTEATTENNCESSDQCKKLEYWVDETDSFSACGDIGTLGDKIAAWCTTGGDKECATKEQDIEACKKETLYGCNSDDTCDTSDGVVDWSSTTVDEKTTQACSS